MKYIGIRGHRGAGKNSIAYLVGQTIEYILNSKATEINDTYENLYAGWCQELLECSNISECVSNKHVIYEGFGDGPKMLMCTLTGVTLQDLNNDWYKDNTVINLKDFSRINLEDMDDEQLVSADEMFNLMLERQKQNSSPSPITENIYMTVREFILYFGVCVMQNFFGLNVWIKSLKASANFFNGLFPEDEKNHYKIYTDIKARSEISYIKDKGGVIIKVERPGHKKSGGMDLLRGDSRYDYNIVINNDIKNMAHEVFNLTKEIIDNYESI